MFAEERKDEAPADEQNEFDYYLQFESPDHIETALRRMLFISLVEAAEPSETVHPHTHFLRFSIASYPETPKEVLEYLCQFDNTQLLVRVAENGNSSASTLEKLANHPSCEVAIAVADNPKTPINVLMQFLQSELADVRYCMAENPALPGAFLQELLSDSNPYVSARAAKTLLRRNPTSIKHLPLRTSQQQEEQRRKTS